MFERMFSRGNARAAARRLSADPSARNYLELARVDATLGRLAEVRRVCEEGLSIHPGDPGLRRMLESVRRIVREDRMRELRRALADSPRPALWRELCDLYLEAGHARRAEDLATRWSSATGAGEALLYRARARVQRFLADRRRDDGRAAFRLLDEAVRAMPGAIEPLKMRLALASRCGAWVEARASLARLLEITPGDPGLEARFRTLASLAERGGRLDAALREVERTGRLPDDQDELERRPARGSVRPRLQALAAAADVRAAFYVRGGTALVQGPRGATAERMARSVREMVVSGRTTARRLGLGQAAEIVLEGAFGSLHAATAEVGAGAVWTAGTPTRAQRESIAALAGDSRRPEEVEA